MIKWTQYLVGIGIALTVPYVEAPGKVGARVSDERQDDTSIEEKVEEAQILIDNAEESARSIEWELAYDALAEATDLLIAAFEDSKDPKTDGIFIETYRVCRVIEELGDSTVLPKLAELLDPLETAYRDHADPDHPDLAFIGAIRKFQDGDMPAAMAHVKREAELRTKGLADDDPKLLHARRNLAVLMVMTGEDK